MHGHVTGRIHNPFFWPHTINKNGTKLYKCRSCGLIDSFYELIISSTCPGSTV